MMKTSLSLPSLLTQSKLFSSQQELQTARSEFKSRLQGDRSQSNSQDAPPRRSLIHFQQNNQGFSSFKNINSSRIEDILKSLKGMKASKTNLGNTIKAQILFNKKEYAKITNYCTQRRQSQRQMVISRLAKLEPLPMKKEIKKTQKFRNKVKTTVGIRTSLNYEIYENNRLAWKPFIDFDAMGVAIGSRVYFMGGRKIVPLTYYDRHHDKWIQQTAIQGLKTFGQSEGTPISNHEIIFFGGTKFYLMGESVVTNALTYVNIETKVAKIQTFEQAKVPGRCFHAQCKYGDFLLISGGINHLNKLYNNVVAFHIIKKYWFQLTIATVEPKLLEGFAKHKMMAILHPRKKYNIYQEDDIIATDEEKKQISHEGIYIFGGEDSNVELSNKIYILTVGKPSIQVYEPKIAGKPPLARKNFGWARVKQFLFIQGGRNDDVKPWILFDLCALNLRTMNWIWVKGDKPTLRHSHTLLPYNDQLIILGGKNLYGLCKQIYPIKYEQAIQYI